MNRKKILSAVSALALIAASVKGSFITAKAAEYTITGGTTTFATYLVMDQTASVPRESIHYTIQPCGTDTTNNITSTDNGATVGIAEFTIDSPTYTEKQDTAITSNHVTNGTNVKDNVTLLNGQKYARASVTADFRNITFNNVGQFDFLIREVAGTDPAMTYDSTPMVMRLFVVYDTTAEGIANKRLSVGGYVMYKATVVTDESGNVTSYTVKDGSDNGTNTKAQGFVNNYTVKSLELAKKVSGNQASHDEYFEFDVTITNALQPGYIYAVADDAGYDTLTTINGLSTTAHTNRSSIEANDQGVATEKYWLHNGQHILITNLPVGTSYTVNENKAEMTTEKYTTTATITGDTINGQKADTTASSVQLLQSGVYVYDSDSAGANTNKTVQTLTISDAGTSAVEIIKWYTRASTSAAYEEANHAEKTITYTMKQLSATQIQLSTTLDGVQQNIIVTLSLSPATLSSTGANPMTYTASTKAGEVPTFVKGTIPNAVGQAITLDTSNLMMSDTYITDNTTITYTNAKTGTVPTGILTTTAPYAAVVLAGFCGLLIFAKKRKKQEEE
jgi:hypothetical protein